MSMFDDLRHITPGIIDNLFTHLFYFEGYTLFDSYNAVLTLSLLYILWPLQVRR